MRKFLYLTAIWGGFFVAWIGFWLGSFALVHLAGGDNQVTPFYGFTSGPGPMIETAILGSTILVAMWHSLNCHEPTCWRIGKHKISGTPYCNRHQADARPQQTAEELLLTISTQLARTNELLEQVLRQPAA